MKTFCLFILVSLLFISSFSSAQTFQAGIKLNNESMSTGPNKFSRSSPLFSSVYFTAAAFTGNDLAFEARMGYNWEVHYNGMETGIFSKYYYKDAYAIGGIAFHHITKVVPDYKARTYFSIEADLFMPALGLGFNPGRNFSVEVMFQHGLNQKIGYYFQQPLMVDGLYHPYSEIFPEVNLKWIMKIGIGYSFSL